MAEQLPGSPWRDLSTAWNAVIEFTAAVTVYGVLGWFADKWLHTGHALFVTGLVLGLVLGIYVLMKRADQDEHDRVAAKRAGRAAS